MAFKRFHLNLPKGLFARATLILLVPVIVLQIVISILITQRHSENVTKAMSADITNEINYIVKEINNAPNMEQAKRRAKILSADFDMQIVFGGAPLKTGRFFYDFSGKFAIQTLKDKVPSLHGIDLVSSKPVWVSVKTTKGPIKLEFSRKRLSPSNTHQLFVWVVFIGILISVIALIFLRNQLRPINKLAEASEAFGRGHFVDVKISGAREVRAATKAFLEMRARIYEQIEQRTLMFSGISHDLRTPLTRLKLGLSLLDEKDTEDLSKDVSDMQALIDSFLDFAQGDTSEKSQNIGFKEFVSSAVALYQKEHKKITFRIANDGKTSLRPLAVKRALDNLIENALRYGTELRIDARLDEAVAIIAVEDNGPGISEADRAQATMPFTRLDKARNQDDGSGVGLGLAIVADIARSHGGSLKLYESPNLGGLCAELILARIAPPKAESDQ